MSQIQFGFIQNGIGFQNDGVYADGKTLKSSLDGMINTSSPVLDRLSQGIYPWYDGNIYTQASNQTAVTITMSDGPMDGPPIYSDQSASWEQNNVHALTSMTMSYNFETYICAQTLDTSNGASYAYTEVASAAWSFDGSGSVTVDSANQNFQWTPGASAGVFAPAGWTVITNGNVPVTTGNTFNDLLVGEAFAAYLPQVASVPQQHYADIVITDGISELASKNGGKNLGLGLDSSNHGRVDIDRLLARWQNMSEIISLAQSPKGKPFHSSWPGKSFEHWFNLNMGLI